MLVNFYHFQAASRTSGREGGGVFGVIFKGEMGKWKLSVNISEINYCIYIYIELYIYTYVNIFIPVCVVWIWSEMMRFC